MKSNNDQHNQALLDSKVLLGNMLLTCWQRLAASARLMVGLPDYDNYVIHSRKQHPDQPVMTYNQFFRKAQETKYGDKNGGGRPCC